MFQLFRIGMVHKWRELCGKKIFHNVANKYQIPCLINKTHVADPSPPLFSKDWINFFFKFFIILVVEEMSSREWKLSYFSSRSASPVSPSASLCRPGHLCSSTTSDWWPSTELCEEIILLGGESWNNYIFWQGDRHFEPGNSYILWRGDGNIPHWSHPTQQSMARPWSVDISKMWIFHSVWML